MLLALTLNILHSCWLSVGAVHSSWVGPLNTISFGPFCAVISTSSKTLRAKLFTEMMCVFCYVTLFCVDAAHRRSDHSVFLHHCGSLLCHLSCQFTIRINLFSKSIQIALFRKNNQHFAAQNVVVVLWDYFSSQLSFKYKQQS